MPPFRDLALRRPGDRRRASLRAAAAGTRSAARDGAFRTGGALPDLRPVLDVARSRDRNLLYALGGPLRVERDSRRRLLVEVGAALLASRLTRRFARFSRFPRRKSTMEIAWIGTGIMGAPMARRLLRAGHHVRVHNRSAEKARALADDGALVAADAAEAARGAEVVFIMV